jgi:hypothetical protein
LKSLQQDLQNSNSLVWYNMIGQGTFFFENKAFFGKIKNARNLS